MFGKKKIDHVWVLTTVKIEPRQDKDLMRADKLLNYDVVRSRTVGVFKDYEEAEWCVMHNSCDISELNYYNFAIIEKVPVTGMYPMPDRKYTRYFWMETYNIQEVSHGEGHMKEIVTDYRVVEALPELVPKCITDFVGWWA